MAILPVADGPPEEVEVGAAVEPVVPVAAGVVPMSRVGVGVRVRVDVEVDVEGTEVDVEVDVAGTEVAVGVRLSVDVGVLVACGAL
jgi:hypothetical protein